MTHATPSSVTTPGQGIDPAKMPGHWLLANLGKRVLRPGGIGLTRRMLAELAVTADDHVVEFAPGLGVTAGMTLEKRPAYYTAVERDQIAAQRMRQWFDERSAYRVVTGLAQETGLPDAEATVVYGEAMLTMQTSTRKHAIVHEAYRLLKPGGRYGIHELCLRPDDLPADHAGAVCKALTQTIHHRALPLTALQWQSLLEAQGFEVLHRSTVPMSLLEPLRLVADEGAWGTLRFVSRLLRQPQARHRVGEMRHLFRKHRQHLAAICIVARKPEG